MLLIELVLLVRQLSDGCINNKLFESAVLSLEAGDVEAALSKSKQLIEANPQDPYALVIAADCFNFYGKEQEGLGRSKPLLLHLIMRLFFLRFSLNSCIVSSVQIKPWIVCVRPVGVIPMTLGLLLQQFELRCFLHHDSEALSLVEPSRDQLISHTDFYPC